MKTSIKIGIRVAVFFAIIIVANGVYKRFFYSSDLRKHADVLTLLPLATDSVQMIYLGESSNFTKGVADVDSRSISNMIAAYYPSLKLHTANKGALHAGIYKVMLQNIPSSNSIETVIVTMNLRSFGADWIYSDLETALQKSVVLIKPGPPILNRINLSFKGYQDRNELERKAQIQWHWKSDPLNFPYEVQYSNTFDWDRGFAREGIKTANGDIDYKKTELACHYIKSYGFYIDPAKNPRIDDFDAIVEICKKRGWNLVFNLLAENTEMGGKLVGDDLLFLMRRNRDFLVDRYQKMGTMVVDNLEDVASDYYTDQDWTTEHYTEEGRHVIARNVADSLRKFYPRQFTEIAIPKVEQQAIFTFDGETASDWKSLETLSDDLGFESEHASKTNSEAPFGATLETTIKSIPDSCRNEIEVRFKVYFEKPAPEVKLVFEFQGQQAENYWHGTDVKVEQAKTWTDFSYRFKMNELNLNAFQVIKIYLWNNSDQTVYSDNWIVEFK